jgi:hypothetical protein
MRPPPGEQFRHPNLAFAKDGLSSRPVATSITWSHMSRTSATDVHRSQASRSTKRCGHQLSVTLSIVLRSAARGQTPGARPANQLSGCSATDSQTPTNRRSNAARATFFVSVRSDPSASPKAAFCDVCFRVNAKRQWAGFRAVCRRIDRIVYRNLSIQRRRSGHLSLARHCAAANFVCANSRLW